MNKLNGFIQSGILYIGDPVYMSGDTREGADNSQCNPFLNWDAFTSGLQADDMNLVFPGSKDTGRGCAIQTGLINGRFEVEKHFGPDGNLSHILVKVLP